MTVLISLAVIVAALSITAYVVNNILISLRYNRSAKTNKKYLEEMRALIAPNEEAIKHYLVTKVYYNGGRITTDVVSAKSSMEAFTAQSDEFRNIHYYIKSVEKM